MNQDSPRSTRLLHGRPARKRPGRFACAPESGPAILFFGGGSGPNPICRALLKHTHNTIHLITPFDSGGSSAKLRRFFAMPAVGDLRNRMMALCDMSVKGNAAVRRLFAHRLPGNQPGESLLAGLERIISGQDKMMAAIPDPLRRTIRGHLDHFRLAITPDFDLKGASIGNLVLTGGYLKNGRRLDAVLSMFSRLAGVRGVVRPVANADLHLYARLKDGSLVLGQHLITGREAPAIRSPIRELGLCENLERFRPCGVTAPDNVAGLIARAELICYPVGSFYTSLLASLLPRGLGRAVAANPCPKVFIPGTGPDPEVLDAGVNRMVSELTFALGAGPDGTRPEGKVLDYVILDSDHGSYPNGVDAGELGDRGLKVMEAGFSTPEGAPRLEGGPLAKALLSLVRPDENSFGK